MGKAVETKWGGYKMVGEQLGTNGSGGAVRTPMPEQLLAKDKKWHGHFGEDLPVHWWHWWP